MRRLAFFSIWAAVAAAAVPAPNSHFGHEIGADRVLVDWSKVVSYFNALEKSSDRVKVRWPLADVVVAVALVLARVVELREPSRVPEEKARRRSQADRQTRALYRPSSVPSAGCRTDRWVVPHAAEVGRRW